MPQTRQLGEKYVQSTQPIIGFMCVLYVELIHEHVPSVVFIKEFILQNKHWFLSSRDF